jgi:hypothetical protein
MLQDVRDYMTVSEAAVKGWLNIVGIESLCQWDILLFLYRHQTS